MRLATSSSRRGISGSHRDRRPQPQANSVQALSSCFVRTFTMPSVPDTLTPEIGQPMARILLAESDDRIRGFIAGILVEFGHDVAACADEAEASEWLTTRQVDVVLTDLVLGDGQGAS